MRTKKPEYVSPLLFAYGNTQDRLMSKNGDGDRWREMETDGLTDGERLGEED